MPVASHQLNERRWSVRFVRDIINPALSTVRVIGVAASAMFKSRAALHLENLALRRVLSAHLRELT